MVFKDSIWLGYVYFMKNDLDMEYFGRVSVYLVYFVNLDSFVLGFCDERVEIFAC